MGARHIARRTRHRAAHGFSLIEMATVVVIAGIVMTLAVPSLAGFIETRRISGVASQLASDLQFARAEAVLRNQALRIGFQPDTACYMIHTGAKDQCRCDATGAAHCETGAHAVKVVAVNTPRVSLHANVASVRFDPLHGTATPAATLRITSAGGREVRQVVNLMGRVRSCSPQAAVSGYLAC